MFFNNLSHRSKNYGAKKEVQVKTGRLNDATVLESVIQTKVLFSDKKYFNFHATNGNTCYCYDLREEVDEISPADKKAMAWSCV